MSVLAARSLTYFYYSDHIIFENLNLDFERGKVYVILGASGSGKTTLLSLLGGLDSPTEGQILFEGQDLEAIGLAAHRKKNVAFIFQSYNLIDYLTPRENVALTSKLPPLPVLERVGITAEESRRNVRKLSGGQQQRVAIARALAMDPKVMLLDEPTSALDPELVGEVLAVIRDLAAGGMTMVMATHQMDFARALATEILFMERGRIIERGSPAQLLADGAGTRTRDFCLRILEVSL